MLKHRNLPGRACAEVKPEWQLDGGNILPLLEGKTDASPHDVLFRRFGVKYAVRLSACVKVQGRNSRVLMTVSRVPDAWRHWPGLTRFLC